ncbi:MAG: metallophosphoesterase [Planctomycetes bacterium]|nr:metallophosphoesterase [Planctomycetota bacterium]
MLPYLQVQSCYVLGAGVATLAVDRWLGARLERASAPRLGRTMRALGTLLALALPLAGWMLLVRALDHSHTKYQFASIALGYYVAAFWWPLVTIAHAWRRPRAVALVSCGVLALAGGQYALWIEPDRIVTATHELAFAQWPRAEPLRVVHISDLQTVGECQRERDAARIVNQLAPDLIVVTGDYVAGPFFDAEPGIAAARRFFQELSKPRLGIVCVDGHCESERVRGRVFEGLDVVYLRNETVQFELGSGRRLRVFGAKTLNLGFDATSLVRRDDPGLVTLAVSHEPDVSWELEGRGVDLHLAGHTHGGQIALPFVGAPFTLSALPRHFARGLHEFGDHWLHVSAGIGMEGNHAPRIRFLCPPQIDLLLLDGGGPPKQRAEVPPKGRP